jgi:hypothetical protein
MSLARKRASGLRNRQNANIGYAFWLICKLVLAGSRYLHPCLQGITDA